MFNVVFSGNQHRRLLPAMCHNLRHAGRCPPATAFTTPSCVSVNTGSQARYRLRIAISAYSTCIRRPRYVGSHLSTMWYSVYYAVWQGKSRMVWLPDGEINLTICLFVLTEFTNVTDRQIDTAWRHRPRLCIASRGKNRSHIQYSQTASA